jgi:hypothetical protein
MLASLGIGYNALRMRSRSSRGTIVNWVLEGFTSFDAGPRLHPYGQPFGVHVAALRVLEARLRSARKDHVAGYWQARSCFTR